MSTAVELPPVDYTKPIEESHLIGKQIESSPSPSSANDSTASSSACSSPCSPNTVKLAVKSEHETSMTKNHKKKEKHHNHHPNNNNNNNNNNTTSIHQFDSRIMGGFYEACVTKLGEVYPSWNESWQLKEKPLFMSSKHVVHDRMIKFIQENQEPAIVLQNFDYGDILNFERFLQMLKQDGVNSISKYKQYLINKDMKKLDLDLVIIHAKYGILLVDIKECDYLDSKRRSKAKVNLSNARQSIENLVKLIIDGKGLTSENKSEHLLHQVPISEVVALPNLRERPLQHQPQQQQQQGQQQQPKSFSSRQLSYAIKSDLETPESFKSWWTTNVAERLEQRAIGDLTLLNHLMGMFSCIRNNSILPVVCKEQELPKPMAKVVLQPVVVEAPTTPLISESPVVANVEQQPAIPTEEFKLSVSAEFFHEKHEEVRSLSRVVIATKDEDRVKRTVCMQILWLLLNDSQKKISVVCSEQNKAFYEEYFKLQRKLYNNLNNVRFYSDLQSCAINGTSHTLKKDGEIWFFDCDLNMSNNLSKDIIDRIKELNAFWVYTQDDQWTTKCKVDLDLIKDLHHVNLDPVETKIDGSVVTHVDVHNKPWVSGLHLKFPLRLQCDLLVIGDMVTPNQLKYLLRYFIR